jgi:uncharacterized membrane protein YcaP (DUF421 family)
MSGLFSFQVPPWQLVLRSVVIYLALLLALRLFGKREVGQFTIYDLVLVLLVANAVQPAMTGPDSSLGGGLIIIGALVLVNFAVARLDRFGLFHRLLVPRPTIIVRDGHYVEEAMGKENVDREQCEQAIREHGLESADQVKLAVLEPDGTISIVPGDANVIHTQRRVRYRRRQV